MTDFIALLRIEPLNDCKITALKRSQKSQYEDPTETNILVPIFTQEVLKIGRNKTNDIKLNNPTISLTHAIIWSVKFDSESTPLVYINDCSRNGILFNGSEMQNGETKLLNDGDQIEFKTAAILSYECLVDSIRETNHLKSDFKINDNWVVTTNLVGTGSFGSVYVAKNLEHPEKLYAVKVLGNKQFFLNKSPISGHNEVKILSKVNHLYNAITTNSFTYIVQDLICGGDLFSYLVKGTTLKAISERESIFIIFQVMKALQFLHKNLNIIHRDLKLDNILLEIPQPKTKIYLCDFGIAKNVSFSNGRTNTSVGTIEYSAPEVFKQDLNGKSTKPYNFKCDIWSLGVITHILLSGISPFYSDQKQHILDLTRRGQLNFKRKQFNQVSNKAQSFIQSLIQIDSGIRLDIDECFEHNWIKANRLKLERFYRENILKK
ncbi:hypothetical protein KGF54_003234 [Candida jiufengensis]|uniref:uncharacterized protein n=1 Tax=Candida jiufengensis TaxID=497108 RepID=UPI00222547ED|nr:uncharacterized protein KGF54_003234 [Candida jiufengensis]KAI5952368.1 hypothetical protein KGF54_003234 [Candida jiufengensis]